MKIFNRLTSKHKPDGYYISEDVDIKVYSDKSLQRESRQLVALLENAVLHNKLLLWISPFHRQIYQDIPEIYLGNLVWVAPVSFSVLESHCLSGVIANETEFIYFLNNVSKNHSYSIETHHSLLKYNFNQIVRKSLLKSAVRLKTIAHFGKIWEFNFNANRKKLPELIDVHKIKITEPDLIVLGGPSVDNSLKKIKNSKNIWCADTALPLLTTLGLIPDLVFTLDAGFGSYEHFIKAVEKKLISKTNAVVDPLSFPQIINIPFKNKFTYSHSNPLLQTGDIKFTFIENHSSDVFGLISSVHQLLFNKEMPEIVGLDGSHKNKVTHFRGSAYHQRQYGLCNRFTTLEKYFFVLSDRYTPL